MWQQATADQLPDSLTERLNDAMLLEIQVYPAAVLGGDAAVGVTDGASSGATPGSAPYHQYCSQTLCVHPSTGIRTSGAANDADGGARVGGREEERLTVLAVGRREPADVLLPQDRSVSRVHCRIHFVPRRTTGGGQVSPPKSKQPRRIKSGTDEDNHPLSYEAVLENVSKTGCYIVVRRKTTQPPTNNHSDDIDSDATDVEDNHPMGPATQAPATQAASATQRFETQGTSQPQGVPGAPTLTMSEATMQILSTFLHQNPNDYELVEVPAHRSFALEALRDPKGTVVIQCGKLGSTLRVTRRTMVLLNKTKAPKVQFSTDLLIGVGAQLADDRRFDPPCTHLVTHLCSSTPSQLSAWCRRVPLVAPSYLHAWADRRHPNDPVPSEADHRPKATEEYWARDPPDWTGWTFLAEEPTKAADEELLAWMRATGARAQLVRDSSHLSQLKSPHRCFAVPNRHWLSPSALEALGVVSCDAKGLAKRLTQHQCPDGSPSPTVLATTTTDPNPPEQRLQSSQPTLHSSVQATCPPVAVLPPRTEPPAVPEPHLEKRVRQRSEPDTPVDSPPTPPPPPRRQTPDEVDMANDDENDHGETRRGSKRSRAVGRVPPAAAHETIAKSRPDATVPDEAATNDSHDDDKATAENSPRPRTKAKPAADGWFGVAGKNQRLSTSQPSLDDEGKTLRPAVTELVKGYLLAHPLGRQNGRSADPSSHRSAARAGDFRAFRKNSVPAAVVPRAPEAYVSVQPKEARSLLKVEAQLHDLEERQRAAEQLFRDPVFPGGRARAR